MADPMLTSLCAICHIATPKYKCPRCGLRSCSLACIQKHKAWSECSGARDPTRYVPPSRLRTPAGVDHDYNFLHGIEMSMERSERELIGERRLVQADELRPAKVQEVRWKTGRDGRKRKVLVTRLLREVKGRQFERFLAQKLRKLNVEVICAPMGMVRQKENNTTLNRRTARINWQVEWFVVEETTTKQEKTGEEEEEMETEEAPTTANKTRYLSKVMDDVPMHEAYRQMLDEHEAAKKRLAKKESRATTAASDEQLLQQQQFYYGQCPASRCTPSPAMLQDPHTGLWFACAGPSVDQWPYDGQREFQYFLARPQTTRPDRRVTVTPLQTTDCLRDVLANTRVLEFPTIVVLRSELTLPEASYVLGPKDMVASSTTAAAAAGPSKIHAQKRKDGLSGEGKSVKKQRRNDDADGNEDEGEDDDSDTGVEEGVVIGEESMGEEDDTTSGSETSSMSESE